MQVKVEVKSTSIAIKYLHTIRNQAIWKGVLSNVAKSIILLTLRSLAIYYTIDEVVLLFQSISVHCWMLAFDTFSPISACSLLNSLCSPLWWHVTSSSSFRWSSVHNLFGPTFVCPSCNMSCLTPLQSCSSFHDSNNVRLFSNPQVCHYHSIAESYSKNTPYVNTGTLTQFMT